MTSNATVVIDKMIKDLSLFDRDKITRIMAESTLGDMKRRIHQEGRNSAGGKIGTYSASYLKTRQKKGRTSDANVILSLTGQMENDFSIVPDEGGWGLGFKNDLNMDKHNWMEDLYSEVIYALTKSEESNMVKDVQNYVNKNSGG